MLNIPAVHQRLVVDVDMFDAQNLLQLADGLVELGARGVGREDGQLALPGYALWERALAEQAGFGLGAEVEEALRQARVGGGEGRGRWEGGRHCCDGCLVVMVGVEVRWRCGVDGFEVEG